MLGRRLRTKPRTSTGNARPDVLTGSGGFEERERQSSKAGGADAATGEAGGIDDEAAGGEGLDGEYDDERAEEYEDEDAEEYEDEDEYTDEYEDEDDLGDDGDDATGRHQEEHGDGGASEPFTPPTFLEAAKQAFLPGRLKSAAAAKAVARSTSSSAGSGRVRARPATGTEEDAKAVNLIDRRERMVGFVLGLGLLALSVVAYVSDHHYVNKSLKLQLQVRNSAVEVMAIFAAIGAIVLVATVLRRRAALGFILAFGGLALLQTLGLFGIIYLGAGGWLIFRASKRSPRSRARQAALTDKRADGGRAGSRTSSAARGASTTGSSGTRTRARAGGESTTAGTGSRGAASAAGQRQIGRNNRSAGSGSRSTVAASGRYTPPKQTRRPPVAKQPDPPEPSNRLTAWLRK